MKKFKKGDWVVYKCSSQSDEKWLGTIISVPDDGTRSVSVRWVRKEAQSGVYAASMLERCQPVPLILEGNLAEDLHETRTDQELLKSWFGSTRSKCAFKSIHQLSDIELIASRLNKQVLPPFIHISCHGAVGDDQRPYIQLFDDLIYLGDPKTVEVFSKFEGYPVYFSACLLGKYEKPIREFQSAAKLGPIAVSPREIYDHEGLLFSVMLYQSVVNSCLPFVEAVENCISAIKLMGVKGVQGHGQSYVRVFP